MKFFISFQKMHFTKFAQEQNDKNAVDISKTTERDWQIFLQII